jgi:hypothetical protein
MGIATLKRSAAILKALKHYKRYFVYTSSEILPSAKEL